MIRPPKGVWLAAVVVVGTVASLTAPVAAEAGPWIREPGHVYSKVGYNLFYANEAFDAAGNRASLADPRFIGHLGELFRSGSYTSHVLSGYVEIGVVPHLELFGSFPVVWARNRWDDLDIRQGNSGVGDVAIGARTGLRFLGSLAASLSVSVSLPLYDNAPAALNTGVGNSDFTDDRIPLGQGTVDVNLAAAFGVSLHRFFAGWVSLEQGARLRNRGYSTGLPGLLQIGWRPHRRWALMANLEWLVTLSDGSAPDFYVDAFGKGPTIIDRQSFFKPGLMTMVDVWKTLALELGFSSILIGRRTAAGFAFTLGVSFRS